MQEVQKQKRFYFYGEKVKGSAEICSTFYNSAVSFLFINCGLVKT